MSVRANFLAATTAPPSDRRLSTSLRAGTGKHSSVKVRLNSRGLAHLRSRVATGTDFQDAPNEISLVVKRVKSLVNDAIRDGELSPNEVAGLYAYVSQSTQWFANQLAVNRMADDRRKRLLKGIQVLTSLTMAGGLLYALINTADGTEPLLPKLFRDLE